MVIRESCECERAVARVRTDQQLKYDYNQTFAIKMKYLIRKYLIRVGSNRFQKIVT